MSWGAKNKAKRFAGCKPSLLVFAIVAKNILGGQASAGAAIPVAKMDALISPQRDRCCFKF